MLQKVIFVVLFYTNPFSLSLTYYQLSNMYNPNLYVVNQPIDVIVGQYGFETQYILSEIIRKLSESKAALPF